MHIICIVFAIDKTLQLRLWLYSVRALPAGSKNKKHNVCHLAQQNTPLLCAQWY